MTSTVTLPCATRAAPETAVNAAVVVQPAGAPFTVRCGACGTELEWPTSPRDGHRPRCSSCRRRLRLRALQRVVCPVCLRPTARHLPADRPHFQCPSCGYGFVVPPPIASAASKRRRHARGRARFRQFALSAMSTLVLVAGFVMLCLLGWLF